MTTGCTTSFQCKIVTKSQANKTFCIQRPSYNAAGVISKLSIPRTSRCFVYERLLSAGSLFVNVFVLSLQHIIVCCLFLLSI